MAGLTSTSSSSLALAPISSKPFLTKPIFLPFLNSPLFGLRFHFPQLRSSSSLFYYSTTVSARYGVGGGGQGDFQPPSSSDDEEALDISSLRSDKVRLIDDEQNMFGIVSKNEAIQRAEDAGLDLVILSPEAEPPVVKIMDYSKYKYEMQKKKKEQQKKSAAGRMDLKELKMGYNIDSHDYSVRLRAAQKFLKDGDKVKVIVNLKGRENEFRNIAIELVRRFQNDIGELATEENKNFRERNIFIVLAPNKAVIQKSQEQPKKKENSATEVSAGVEVPMNSLEETEQPKEEENSAIEVSASVEVSMNLSEETVSR